MNVVRSVNLLLRRNQHNDTEKDNIKYCGFDICWPNGESTQVNFAKFCQVGIRTIFGKTPLLDQDYQVVFQFRPVAADDPSPVFPKPIRPRRMYIKREGDAAVFYFHNAMPTEIFFTIQDDPRVLEWIGWQDLVEGQEHWFDFVALVEHSGNYRCQNIM